jgi:phage gp46-like protein
MTDIALTWSTANGSADWAIVGGDIATGSDLQTAVILSLFTDARAPDTYKPGSSDRRGWWGNRYSQTPWGSLLYTLGSAVVTGPTSLLLQAQSYCETALQWMITDGVASAVSASCSFLTSTLMLIAVTITEPSPGPSTTFQFSWAWAGVGG